MLRDAPRPQSEDDLYAAKGQVAAMEEAVARLMQEVAAMQRAAGDDKLAMFRQQSALIAKKLAQREEALETTMRDVDTLARELEAKVRWAAAAATGATAPRLPRRRRPRRRRRAS